MDARERRRITVDEYVQLDRSSEERWDYVSGEAFAIAGASPEHNLVARNISHALTNALRGKPSLAMSEGQKIATPRTRAYFHPDAVVVCGKPAYDERDDHAIVNPTVLVEVLSPSTSDYDRGGKLVHYRSLESLTDYVLVSIEDRSLEHHHRVEPNEWVVRTALREGALELDAIGIAIPIADLWLDLDRLAR